MNDNELQDLQNLGLSDSEIARIEEFNSFLGEIDPASIEVTDSQIESLTVDTPESEGAGISSAANISGTPTSGNDTIIGSRFADLIDALEGDDTLRGRSGNDTLKGSAGNDDIAGQAGNDVIDGGSGNDTIFGNDDRSVDPLEGGFGNNSISGSYGEDTIVGGLTEDTIRGGSENDNISAQGGDDVINGGNGDDLIFGDSDLLFGSGALDLGLVDDNFIDLFFGNDSISGGAGMDNIIGSLGEDTLLGGTGDDDLSGGNDNDSIRGGNDTDNISGGEGDDILKGDSGNDRVIGQDANDLVFGGDGDDSLYGDRANDLDSNNIGSDTLEGDDGNDILIGGADSDSLNGGSGSDLLNGVENFLTTTDFGADTTDTLTGGAGSDTFVLGGENENGEEVVYYNDGNPEAEGTDDYALITDFRFGEKFDYVGSADDYTFDASPEGEPSGIGIFLEQGDIDELIAIVQFPSFGSASTGTANATANVEGLSSANTFDLSNNSTDSSSDDLSIVESGFV